jgi:lipopolysaccharide export system permease protein
MKTIRLMIYREVLQKVGFATLGFLGLFFFFDTIDELKMVGLGPQGAYSLRHAMWYVVLMVPNHLYELLPITVLIGTIFVMARLAQSSEFTILRTSGLGPLKALRTLLEIGLIFVVIAFLVGDYLTPASSRQAQLLKAKYLGQTITNGSSGAWLKENKTQSSSIVNVLALSRDGQLGSIRIFEFNSAGKLTSILKASSGKFLSSNDAWLLTDVVQDTFSDAIDSNLERNTYATLKWPNALTEDMVSVALLKPERMATWDLFKYINHLKRNDQASQRYEIDFWKKVFYPISCIVMVMLALPFAYLHLRNANMNTMVFFGVVIGITFVLINNLFGYIGNLNSWPPWLAAATPGLVFTAGSLAAFARLVWRH